MVIAGILSGMISTTGEPSMNNITLGTLYFMLPYQVAPTNAAFVQQ
jgi:hypothetical protein